MKSVSRLHFLVVILFGVNLSCSDDNRTEPPSSLPDAEFVVPPDTGTEPGDAGIFVLPDLGFVDAGFPDSGGDGNDSFDTAMPLTKGSFNEVGAINPPGDRDFYSVEVTAGEWLFFRTVGTADPVVDTVLRLYTPDRTLVATNDDALPRTDVNPELIYHADQTGTYYLEVLEFSDWNTMDMIDPEGGEDFTYTVGVVVLDEAARGVNIDAEAGDDETQAQLLNQEAAVVIVGTFNDETDVDVYRFTSTSESPRQVEAYIVPPGTTGYGGTSASVWMTDTSSIPARIGFIPNTVNYREVAPNLAQGDYFLFVGQPATPQTDNPHYAIKLRFFQGDNPPEAGEPNDTLATAEALTLADGDPRSVFVLGDLPEGDVDYYGVDIEAGENISVACGAEGSGSAVRGFLVEVRDAADMVLGMATESPPRTAFTQDVVLPGAGRYYARISSDSQDPNGGRPFYRCGIRAVPRQ